MRRPRWFVWWRRPAASPQLCLHCAAELAVCPSCRGEWAGRFCPACGLGLTCPTHRSHWF